MMKNELLRFCIAGGITFLFELVLLYIFVEWFFIFYLYATAIAFMVAVMFNYYVCVVWVFSGQHRKTSIGSKLFFALSSLVGLGLNQMCMWELVSVLGVHYITSKFLATAIVTSWNYVTKKWALSDRG